MGTKPVPRGIERPRLLSLVCPVFNEEETLLAFHKALRVALKSSGQIYETVFVDDGSTDGSLAILRQIRAAHPNTAIVALSRNFGKEAAIAAGLDAARGDAVVILDADLQHPLDTIERFVEGWREGYDVVYGERVRGTEDGWLRRRLSTLFYTAMARLGERPLPENAGDFRLMSRKAVDAVRALRERHRFMKGIFSWVGFSVKAVPYVANPRAGGVSKFRFGKLVGFSIEGLTAHTMAPLRLATWVGLATAGLCVLHALSIFIEKAIFGIDVEGYPTLMLTVLFLGSVQLIVLGIMGEYIGRIFNETKNRPLYIADTVEESAIAEIVSAPIARNVA